MADEDQPSQIIEPDGPSIWDQFDRLQRQSGKSAGPKGVFCFRTFEEFNAWKEQMRREYPDNPQDSE